MWQVEFTDEFEAWWADLSESEQEAIVAAVGFLEEMGPSLRRPFVDTIKSSRHSNMKELRSRFAGHQYRTLFAFDPKQHALLLIGGDKVGQDQARFYKALIKLADAIFDRHLVRIAKENKTIKRSGA